MTDENQPAGAPPEQDYDPPLLTGPEGQVWWDELGYKKASEGSPAAVIYIFGFDD